MFKILLSIWRSELQTRAARSHFSGVFRSLGNSLAVASDADLFRVLISSCGSPLRSAIFVTEGFSGYQLRCGKDRSCSACRSELWFECSDEAGVGATRLLCDVSDVVIAAQLNGLSIDEIGWIPFDFRCAGFETAKVDGVVIVVGGPEGWGVGSAEFPFIQVVPAYEQEAEMRQTKGLGERWFENALVSVRHQLSRGPLSGDL
jgi:hypothetical protein